MKLCDSIIHDKIAGYTQQTERYLNSQKDACKVQNMKSVEEKV